MPDTTTVAAEHNEQPAIARPVSAMQRALVWATVVGVIAAGAVGLAVSDLTMPGVRGGSAARFVPADGTASLVTAADGTRTVHENARGTGPGMLLELPTLAGAHFFEERSSDALTTMQLWRESITYLDEDVPQNSTLYELDERGISMLTSLGGEVGFSYAPGLVVLPADAAPGVTWEGEGAAMPGNLYGYRMTGELSAADAGCLLATTDTRYIESETGDEVLTILEKATWCPGQGIVIDDGDVSGSLVSFRSEQLPEIGGLGGDVVTEPAESEWGATSGWRSRDLGFQLSDPAYGDSPQGVPFDGLAAMTSGGTLVASVGSRVAGYTVDGTTATRAWVASPGGDLLEVTAVGEVTLVSTAQRRLLAYDERGARLWSMRFPDVVVAPPTSAGDGDIVVVSLDGTLRRIDLATGETVWSVALRTDVSEAPAIGGGLVVVVDRGGAVLARSLADGVERWSAELFSAERAAIGDGVVAVQGTNSDVWALEARDGAVRWNHDHSGVARTIALVGGTVVSQSDEGTVAWDAQGRQAWMSGASEALLDDGERIVLVGEHALELRDTAGELLEEVEIGPAPIGATRSYLATARGIRILQSNTTGLEVR
ncbi:MAG: outer membrane protein assembly factor BamB family protein [Protaetiibacter sp.]